MSEQKFGGADPPSDFALPEPIASASAPLAAPRVRRHRSLSPQKAKHRYDARPASGVLMLPTRVIERKAPDFSFFEQRSVKRETAPSPQFKPINRAIEFSRIRITGQHDLNDEDQNCCVMINKALKMRDKYVFVPRVDEEEIRWANKHYKVAPEYTKPAMETPTGTEHCFLMVDGVGRIYDGLEPPDLPSLSSFRSTGAEDDQADSPAPEEFNFGLYPVVDVDEFWNDLQALMDVVCSGPVKTFCYNRLKICEARFNLHVLLNEHREIAEQKRSPHRDFYNVRKIDNHVHHSACMNQKHLLRFIKNKIRTEPNTVVAKKQGKELTLQQVFQDLGMSAYELSVDALDTHAKQTFHRFDKFNTKYNPLGQTLLREIFLKNSNHMDGLYLAQVTQQVFDELEQNKYQFAEYRLSIYGKDPSEWSRVAAWVVDNGLFHANVRWMIQIPRLYAVYKKVGLISNFQDMIDNIFQPLFDVSINPQKDPKLHCFLKQVVGFDTVDDESIRERPQFKPVYPEDWTRPNNPPYSMWTYYIYANLFVLNQYRQAKGFTTFDYRPHAGEAGDVEHLAAAYLTAKSINHGLVLWDNPALQYLFYLRQIGLSMSPLSNNLLFIEYDKNPFFRFFRRGLNVTLSTDDPLLIHVTKEPLVEEYSVAAQVWKLSAVDVCEIARSSVMQSGFEHKYKAHWIGRDYYTTARTANDLNATNVPDIRFQFRLELLDEERRLVTSGVDQGWKPTVVTAVV